jgi:hypothetical protein
MTAGAGGHRGRWYLVGHDRDRADVRSFRLSPSTISPATSACIAGGRVAGVGVPGVADAGELAARLRRRPARTATSTGTAAISSADCVLDQMSRRLSGTLTWTPSRRAGPLTGRTWDVLITVGRDADPGMFGEPPPHVSVERWVDQATVLGHTAAVLCPGGGGSVLGALAAGAPLVVVPLFAEDQHINARRIAAVGAV